MMEDEKRKEKCGMNSQQSDREGGSNLDSWLNKRYQGRRVDEEPRRQGRKVFMYIIDPDVRDRNLKRIVEVF